MIDIGRHCDHRSPHRHRRLIGAHSQHHQRHHELQPHGVIMVTSGPRRESGAANRLGHCFSPPLIGTSELEPRMHWEIRRQSINHSCFS
ncbi:hypothetical protein BKA56DRAFT_586704 [Ilyonectria sp. MPI-CAGE-AT-0026]|nr:hypothetical protein BKA56DRAFT_586704 [Ilyonectria sp. MPI-CAGE-AT-0026]